jgi:hypothetical protein
MGWGEGAGHPGLHGEDRDIPATLITRAMAAASDHHEASPVFRGAGVLPNISCAELDEFGVGRLHNTRYGASASWSRAPGGGVEMRAAQRRR